MELYDYGYGYDFAQGAAAGVAGFMGVFFALYYLLVIGFGIAAYVLQAVSMYTIAKRRGIHHSWLAWLPVGDMWLLGSISDQYQYVAKGRVRNRRKTLLGLTAAMFALMLLLLVAAVMMVVSEVVSYDAGEMLVGSSLAVMLLVYLAVLVVAVILVVFKYMALYDLFVSSDPGNAVLYLVLSILVSVTLPFFLFACRNKDKGMPPRRVAQPVAEIPELEQEEQLQTQEEQPAEAASVEEEEPPVVPEEQQD